MALKIKLSAESKKIIRDNPAYVRGTDAWHKAVSEIGTKSCESMFLLMTLTESEVERLHHVEKRLSSNDYFRYFHYA